MVSRQYQRSKGNQFEYECEHNLKKMFQTVKTLERRGFAKGWDITCNNSDISQVVVECKNHKSMSWNEMVKTLKNLIDKKPEQLNLFCL